VTERRSFNLVLAFLDCENGDFLFLTRERVGSSPRTYDPQEEESTVLQRVSRLQTKLSLALTLKEVPMGNLA
jgi:hypothetical protein